MWCRVDNGVVVEIADIDPAGRYHPAVKWHACPADVEPGWVFNGVVFSLPPPPPLPALAEVRADVVAAINAAFETACSALLADEPPSATATYAVQQAEAESWDRDNSAPTPMLDMLATARGIDKGELVRRVLAKAALYAQASGLLLGQQQRLMDDITAIMATPDLSDELKIVALEQLDIRIGLPAGVGE